MVTQDTSFKTAAGLSREYSKTGFFFWKHTPGEGRLIALPPVDTQILGKYICFLVTRATGRQYGNPENLVIALTCLKEFSVGRQVTSLSLPFYDPNPKKLDTREL